ncbi:DMT family transporter [uncultured Lentibacter sp.]|uniref:DMT family transporter n=1 Tax=uncultured Lentibacter sp. TaxID=1659309 RepID=UPI00260B373F|nr:DMT family transporter [uncultured Lentibacter sp.]
MSDQMKGLLITLMGVLFVVPDSLFIRLIDVPPLEISFWRGLGTGLIVLAYVLLSSGARSVGAALRGGPYAYVYLVAMSGTGILFTLAVSHTSVANVVFIIASMPVFAAILSFLVMGERMSLRMMLTMLAVFVGLGIITYGSGETHGASLTGDLMAVCVSFVFAVALTAARRVRSVSMVPMLPVAYLLSALCLLPFVQPLQLGVDQFYLVALHGLFIAISSVGLALGPRYIPSAEVALLILLESVLAPLLVWFALGEDPGGYALVGGTIVIGALALSNLVVLMRRRPRAAPTGKGAP